MEEKRAKPLTMSVWQLIQQIREGHKYGKRFCFILGAGASVESGIPDGQSMEFEWMNYILSTPDLSVREEQAAQLMAEGKMEHRLAELLEVWKNPTSLARKKLPSEYYFDIFALRFPDATYGDYALQCAMENITPSIGYHPLALLLADPTNGSNLVITTNFDSLVEDALALYTDVKPLVINHEYLAEYAGNSNFTRPIIAKIHRGIYFNTFNNPDDTGALKGTWTKVLSDISKNYTPIVIGYGGGDHSLMDFLKNADLPMRSSMYWCYRSGIPNEDILDTIRHWNGFLVKIDGFDFMMWNLGMELNLPIGPDTVKERWQKQQNDRMQQYRAQLNRVRPYQSEERPLSMPVEPRISEEPPKTAWDFYKQGQDFRNSGAYEEAIRAYTQAIELDSKTALFFFERAWCYDEMRDYSEAIVDYTQAIALNPQDDMAYYNRGVTYSKLGKYPEAIADYTQATALNPQNDSAYYNRGVAYCNLGQHPEAIADYTQAIALNPQKDSAYNNRGNAYGKLDKYPEAIADYTRAISLNPQNDSAYNNRGCTHFELGQYPAALEDVNKAIEINPKYIDAYESRAEIYRATNQIALAEADEAMAEKLKAEQSK